MNKKLLLTIIIVSMAIATIAIVANMDNSDKQNIPETSVDQILSENDFSNWSINEQKDLTEMMRLTASGKVVNLDGKTERVLITYIQLLENAGYK